MAPLLVPTTTLGRARLSVGQWNLAGVHGAGLLPQLSRYTLVSAAALAFDFAVYLALTKLAVWPALAGVAGYAAGTGLHYLLSLRFVFDARLTHKAHARLLGEFAVTGAGGMVMTALVIAAATDSIGIAVLPAKVLAAAANFILVFALRRCVVFAARSVDDASGACRSRFGWPRPRWGRALPLPVRLGDRR